MRRLSAVFAADCKSRIKIMMAVLCLSVPTIGIMQTASAPPALAHRQSTQAIHRPPHELDLIIRSAATEFGVDPELMARIAWRESRFKNPSGRRYVGPFQQSRMYWQGRVSDFNRANPARPVGGDIHSITDNTRVSAWMLSKPGGRKHWPNTAY